MVFVIHWHESAIDIHVFPIPIPPPTSLSTRSLLIFPVHQVWALVSCIQPELVICFNLDNTHVLMLFSRNIPPWPSPTGSKILFYTSVSLFLVAYRVIVTIFLNSIDMCSCLLHSVKCVEFHPSHQNWFKWILFNGWVIVHGVFVPKLPYPFICWWASRLLLCPGYDKQCCDEHLGVRVTFRSGFLGVYAQKWDCWVIWQLYFQVLKEISTLFSLAVVLVCIPTNSVRGFRFLHTLSSIYCL